MSYLPSPPTRNKRPAVVVPRVPGHRLLGAGTLFTETTIVQHVRCFSEFNSTTPGITPMVRIDFWYARNAGHWGAVASMRARVDQQIEQLLARPDGERAIMLWWLLVYELYPDRGADPIAVFERGEVDVRRTLAMLKPLSRALKRRRIPIDLIHIDNEGGFSFYNLGSEWIRRILRSPRARSKMPPEVAAVNPDHLHYDHPNFVNAKAIWDSYAERLHYDALRKVVVESRMFYVKPGPGIPVMKPSAVNFWAVNPTWPIYDYNGWRLNYTSLDGRSSGPSSYVGNYGTRYTHPSRIHHPIWNNFIGMLNQVRSCLGRPNSVVHPVINDPLNCHPWIYEQMIAHMVRCGINWTQNRCAFIYWNANAPSVNDPIVAEIMQRHDLAVPIQRNLPEIPLDVDVVQTGDYVTTYEDFLDNMDEVINGGGGG